MEYSPPPPTPADPPRPAPAPTPTRQNIRMTCCSNNKLETYHRPERQCRLQLKRRQKETEQFRMEHSPPPPIPADPPRPAPAPTRQNVRTMYCWCNELETCHHREHQCRLQLKRRQKRNRMVQNGTLTASTNAS